MHHRRLRAAAAALAIAAYLGLALTWFDHEGKGRVGALLPALFAFLLVASLAVSFALARRMPRPFPDARDNRLFGAVIALAVAVRLPFLFGAYGLFSSDAAVQGVMALHIVEGKHRPIFLYGWSYLGSLKAHVTAFLTMLSGEPVVSFALAGILFYGAFTGALFVLARTVLPRGEALVAAGYAVVSPGFLTAWGLHNEGSYVDVLAFGTLLLALGARFIRHAEGRARRAFWMGILGGLAFWTHILATYYLAAALLLLAAAGERLSRCEIARRFGRLGAFAGGAALGYFPGLLWNASNEWLSFRWWALDQAPAGDRLSRAVEQLSRVASTSLSVLAGWWPTDHPPWPAGLWRWPLVALIPVALAVFVVRRRATVLDLARGRWSPEALVVLYFFLVIAIFAQSSFGWMTGEPRYLLFVFSVVPIFVAAALGSMACWSRRAAVGAAAALLFVHLHGSGVYLRRALASDRVNRAFLADVVALGARYAHTDYHVSYKYNFMSHGRLVWTSALGPSQTEWYRPYREEVARADAVALVPRSFRMARRIGRRLDERGISYRRKDLLYPVLYDFSREVRLEDLR